MFSRQTAVILELIMFSFLVARADFLEQPPAQEYRIVYATASASEGTIA